jgi:hypothetical protein
MGNRIDLNLILILKWIVVKVKTSCLLKALASMQITKRSNSKNYLRLSSQD